MTTKLRLIGHTEHLADIDSFQAADRLEVSNPAITENLANSDKLQLGNPLATADKGCLLG